MEGGREGGRRRNDSNKKMVSVRQRGRGWGVERAGERAKKGSGKGHYH